MTTCVRTKEVLTMLQEDVLDRDALRNDVMAYVYMVLAHGSLRADKIFSYRDEQTGAIKEVKIDKRYIDAVEEMLALTTQEMKAVYRRGILKGYGRAYALGKGEDRWSYFRKDENLLRAVRAVKAEMDATGSA